MKNTVQSHLKSGKSSRSSQEKTSHNKPAAVALPEPGIKDGLFGGNQPVCLLLYDHRKDGTIAGADTTPAQIRALKQTALDSGKSISELLQAGVNHVIAHTPTICLPLIDLRNKVENVRHAALQADVLLELLENFFNHLNASECFSQEGGPRGDEFVLGFGLIAGNVRNELVKSSRAVYLAAYAPAPEVAS